MLSKFAIYWDSISSKNKNSVERTGYKDTINIYSWQRQYI